MKIKKFVKNSFLTYKMQLFFLILLNIVYFITSYILPYITGKFVDLLMLKQVEAISNLLKMLTVIVIMEVISGYFKEIIRVTYKEQVSSNLVTNIVLYVNKIPLLKQTDKNAAFMSRKISGDASMSVALYVDFLFAIIVSICSIVVGCLIIFQTNITIFAVVMILIPVYLILYFVFKNPITNSFEKFINAQSGFFATINEQIAKTKFIKINSLFDFFTKRSKKSADELVKYGLKHFEIDTLFSNVAVFLNRVALIILFFLSAKYVMNNQMTIGEFTILNTYYALVISNMVSLMESLAMYRNTYACMKRLDDIVSIESERNGEQQIKNIDTIELKNINFAYDENNKIFDKLNYKFTKGNIYTLIGENGKGKSTFINLLIGLFDNYTGDICYNNKNISNINLYDFRNRLLGFTEQEPILINGTLSENLNLNGGSISEDKIKLYFESLNAGNIIEKLPNGLNTPIYSDSVNLSGGEKQKIAIIRTLLKNPQLIILDEPTSALDKNSIQSLKVLLNNIKKDKIIIIITHDEEIKGFFDEKIEL